LASHAFGNLSEGIAVQDDQDKPTWITGAQLRRRWGMSSTCLRERVKEKRIPPPEYPFGDVRPYFRLAEVEAFEARRYYAPEKEVA
jgi:hypothetical protein